MDSSSSRVPPNPGVSALYVQPVCVNLHAKRSQSPYAVTVCVHHQEAESMGRYTGPKARVNRRLGFQIFENAGAIRALDKKAYPPGMAQKRRKTSIYGEALNEKQKIKYYYGLREKHLRRYFDKAKRLKGNTGESLMVLCERRLDNVIRRAGFTLTRPQARQGIVHGHFLVNGRRVDRPSYQCNAGDVITVKNRTNLKKLYSEMGSGADQSASWINFDKEELKAIVTSLPTADDCSLPVDVGAVVAFMSR
jgi:ribosomal protein S4, bacterial/organelle type